MRVELAGHYGYKRLVKTMMPCVAMMLITSIYSIVDGFFVSNFAGSTEFAAMNIIWPVIALLSALGLLLGTGGSALVSKTLGEGDAEKACRIFTMMVRLGIIAGVILAAVMFIFMIPIVVGLGSDFGMIAPAVKYGKIVILALPFFIVQMIFQSFYMVAEKPQLGTMMSIVCGLANVGLDALLVVVFKMGLVGAAIATAISLIVGGVFPLIWFSSKRNTTHLHFVRTGFDWKAIGKACTNGLSEYVGNIAFNILGICYNLQLMKYIGENGVAAYGILMYVGFIFAAVFIGYNVGVSQLIAFNYGARNTSELKSLLRKSFAIIGVAGFIMAGLAEALARPIADIFVGYDYRLCELTVRALRIYMLSFLICGFSMFVSAWFTALNNGVVSAIAAFARSLVFELTCVFVLPLALGLDGIWMAAPVAEILALILSFSLLGAFRSRYGY